MSDITEVDKIEIITLQDNYIDVSAIDSNAIVARALPIRDGEIKNSIQAEHGFSAIVKTTKNGLTRSMLFDFGFSSSGAAYNARALGLSMADIEVMALSHGHSDHTGGIEELTRMVGRKGIELVVHPVAFEYPRYIKPAENLKLFFPRLRREDIASAGATLIETRNPLKLLDGQALFLGEIERITSFERGYPIAYREKDGKEIWDPIEDDSALALHLAGKGLIILSGCAHSGIVNTVKYAQKITGIEHVHVVMGGFHLSGPLFEPIIENTTEEIKSINPDFVIPCHCTGRAAMMHFERKMPEKFILNMSGTKLTFKAETMHL
ncbi:MAG: MBL fold metallo-hydrolase [Syntrophales bacterium]|jgi:7,8-dihydropterin-6-yl-methyl-4-(beta-D-ribofuranosyl)aminobenzene 5'-phosphate synthase|nr:MBL fold metallo-hydrolase [Syntrophales bacterium]MDY0043690.1 MBL fold metallo-hydrolase [Syntrophales bacterium]